MVADAAVVNVDPWQYVVVGVFGGALGAAELIGRYRDDPFRALGSLPALFYVLLNLLAAMSALALIGSVFHIDFGIAGDPAKLQWTRVLAAGFGAMAVFRSSLFTLRVGNQDVGIGPATFLKGILDACDRAVDRQRAAQRTTVIQHAMVDVSFARAQQPLTTFCLALMQNLSADEQKTIADQIANLGNAAFDDKLKSMVLGLYLVNIVGPDVLTHAVETMACDLMLASAVTVKPPQLQLKIGSSASLVATATASRGKVVVSKPTFTWTVGDQTIASVDPSGTVSGLKQGSTAIAVACDGAVGTVTVSVA
jgi:hypothetical protein